MIELIEISLILYAIGKKTKINKNSKIFFNINIFIFLF
jgi:hypothetical protein